jgi:hypothetical protein
MSMPRASSSDLGPMPFRSRSLGESIEPPQMMTSLFAVAVVRSVLTTSFEVIQ